MSIFLHWANFTGAHKNCALVNNTPKSKILEIKRWDVAVKPWNKKSILSRETVYIADVNHRWPQIHPPTSRWRCVCFCLCVNTRWTQATSKAAWDAGREICLRAFHFSPSIMRIRNFLRYSSRNSIIIFRAFLTKGPFRHPSCIKVWALLLSPECPHSECLCNYAQMLTLQAGSL